jgi:transcriptional regulator with XRE-family HTH domain
VNHGEATFEVTTYPFYIELGRRISHRRRQLNKTQEELAIAVGLKRTSITNLEKGRQKVLIHTLVEVANCLQIGVCELIPDQPGTTRRGMAGLESETLEILLRAIPELNVMVKK